MHLVTSCCSTDSERPYRCCYIPDKFGSRRIFLIQHNGPGDRDAPKLRLFVGDSVFHVIYMFDVSTYPSGISIGSAVLAHFMVVNYRQTHRPTETHGCIKAYRPNMYSNCDNILPCETLSKTLVLETFATVLRSSHVLSSQFDKCGRSV